MDARYQWDPSTSTVKQHQSTPFSTPQYAGGRRYLSPEGYMYPYLHGQQFYQGSSSGTVHQGFQSPMPQNVNLAKPMSNSSPVMAPPQNHYPYTPGMHHGQYDPGSSLGRFTTSQPDFGTPPFSGNQIHSCANGHVQYAGQNGWVWPSQQWTSYPSVMPSQQWTSYSSMMPSQQWTSYSSMMPSQQWTKPVPPQWMPSSQQSEMSTPQWISPSRQSTKLLPQQTPQRRILPSQSSMEPSQQCTKPVPPQWMSPLQQSLMSTQQWIPPSRPLTELLPQQTPQILPSQPLMEPSQQSVDPVQQQMMLPQTHDIHLESSSTPGSTNETFQSTPSYLPTPPQIDTLQDQHVSLNESQDCRSSSNSAPPFSIRTITLPDNTKLGIKINSMAANFQIPMHIPMRDIAGTLWNCEYKTDSVKLSMRLRDPMCHAYIYSSGKVIVFGNKSVDDARRAARIIGRKIQKVMKRTDEEIRILQFRVNNILANCYFSFGIRIAELARKYPLRFEYEPEIDPCLIYRSTTPRAVLRIYSTGTVGIMGATSEVDVDTVMIAIYPKILEFKSDSPEETEAHTGVTKMLTRKRKRANELDNMSIGSKTKRRRRCKNEKDFDNEGDDLMLVPGFDPMFDDEADLFDGL